MNMHPLVPNYYHKVDRLTTCSDLDMVGILSRDFDISQGVSDLVFNVSHDSTPPAKPTLIYPSQLFPVEDQAAKAIYEEVVPSLKRLLQVEWRVVNSTEEWSRTRVFTAETFEDYFAAVNCPLEGLWGVRY
jgi:hypothetical protein